MLLLGLFLYIFFAPYYRLSNGDDPWRTSTVYDIVMRGGINYIRSFIPNMGEDNLLVGTIHAYVYGTIFNIFGWLPIVGMRISTAFFALSLLLWWQILKALNFSKAFTLSILFTMLILETYFGMASQSRTDSITFFFVTLAFFLFIRQWYLFSGFVLMLAVETHYIGITGFFYCFAYLLAYRPNIKRIAIYFTLGVAIGVALYLYLHLDAVIIGFTGTLAKSTGGSITDSNYLLAYFFRTKYFRHIPELIIFATALIVFMKQKLYKEVQGKFILIFLICTIVSTLILRRGNFHYAPFTFVALLLITMSVAERYHKIWLLNLLWLALLIPQYGYVYYKQHTYPGINAYIEMIRQEVPTDLPIFGDSRVWYAFVGREKTHHMTRLGFVYDDMEKYNYDAFYLTGYDEDTDIPMIDVVNKVSTKYDCTTISETEFYNNPVVTWKCIKR
jgi:hypothetical protein